MQETDDQYLEIRIESIIKLIKAGGSSDSLAHAQTMCTACETTSYITLYMHRGAYIRQISL